VHEIAHHFGISDQFEASGSFRRLATMAREGLGIMRTPLPAATATLYQSVAGLSQLLAVFATLRAFGLALPFCAAALVLALVNLARTSRPGRAPRASTLRG
jgi:hypothetical protein